MSEPETEQEKFYRIQNAKDKAAGELTESFIKWTKRIALSILAFVVVVIVIFRWLL